MLLGLIFSILTATYTLSSTTAVEASGDVPAGATCYYERSATTGQKGQMTANNSTRLSLQGWEGCRMKTLTLWMRSNKASGAGSLQVKIGERTVWTIADESFASEAWAGYYTTDWVAISRTLDEEVAGEIDIAISASENSLYIQRYEIGYEPAQPRCYRLEFVTGLDTCPAAQVQSAIGAPVILPMWQDTAIWRFEGWSEVEIEEDDEVAALLQPGAAYVPNSDRRLWAVYSDGERCRSVREMVSGEYVLAMRNELTESVGGSGMAMCAAVDHAGVALCDVAMTAAEGGYELNSQLREDMVYDVTCVDDSTLYLHHVATMTGVGYSATELAATSSLWRYKLLDDGSFVLYYPYDGKNYALYFGVVGGLGLEARCWKVNVDGWQQDGLWLFPAQEVIHTSWPFGKFEGVEDVILPDFIGKKDGCVMRFGVYELWVKDGHKLLKKVN